MDYQAYVRIRSAEEGGVLHAAYTQAYRNYWQAQLHLAETRMQLAFHDQRLAGHIMQTNRTDVVGMGERVSWGYTQRKAYQVIEQCRDIISKCKSQLHWAGAPSYATLDVN